MGRIENEVDMYSYLIKYGSSSKKKKISIAAISRFRLHFKKLNCLKDYPTLLISRLKYTFFPYCPL